MLSFPPGIRIALTLVWLALTAFLLAHLTSLFVAEAIGAKVGPMRRTLTLPPPPNPPSPQELGSLILNSSVFPGDRYGPVLTGPNEGEGQNISMQLNVELVGTVVGDNALSYAILQSPQSANQSLYRLGDSIPQVGTLLRIERHRVVIALDDGRQATLQAGWMKDVTMPSSSDIAPQFSSGGEVRTVMPRREIVEAFSNLPHLLQQAKATPIISDTGMDGVSFELIQSASIFDRLGFQIGDELKAINGVALRDPGTLLTALRQIQNESSVELDVVRNNQKITMHYDIR